MNRLVVPVVRQLRKDVVDVEASLQLGDDVLHRDVGLGRVADDALDLSALDGPVRHLVADDEQVAALVALLEAIHRRVAGHEVQGQLVGLGDVPAATAILDRFLQQAEIIQITGRSYRLRNASSTTAAMETKSGQPEKKSADKVGK